MPDGLIAILEAMAPSVVGVVQSHIGKGHTKASDLSVILQAIAIEELRGIRSEIQSERAQDTASHERLMEKMIAIEARLPSRR